MLERAGIQDGLGSLLNDGLLRVDRLGPGKAVADDILGITIIDLQLSRNNLHPYHMHI